MAQRLLVRARHEAGHAFRGAFGRERQGRLQHFLHQMGGYDGQWADVPTRADIRVADEAPAFVQAQRADARLFGEQPMALLARDPKRLEVDVAQRRKLSVRFFQRTHVRVRWRG